MAMIPSLLNCPRTALLRLSLKSIPYTVEMTNQWFNVWIDTMTGLPKSLYFHNNEKQNSRLWQNVTQFY